jgi:signal transduction histidine kinase
MSSVPRDSKTSAGTRAWRTIGFRLAIWYVTVTLASFLALAAIVPFTVRAWVESESQRSTAGALDRYKRGLELGGTDALRAMFDCHGDPEASSIAIRLTDEQNVELFSAASDEDSGRIADQVSEHGEKHFAPHRAPEGWHVAGAAVSQGRQLEILLHDESAPRMWRRAREASLWVLGCGLASAVLGAFMITRRGLRPIGDLARASQGVIDSGDLTLRVPTHGTHDSLDQLGTLFNRMLARNEALVRAMKESLDNVAHDLRTPLTRLRAGAELALRDTGDAVRAHEALAETIEESDRVLGMLTTLMDITEAETGAMRLDKRVEDLALIAREAVELYDLVSTERGVHMVTRLEPGVFVSVDRARIRQVFANLIDNAVKYTAAGGQVKITVSRVESKGVFEITDTGIGVSPEDLPRVWDRLYRGDRSRTERGLGLGLSLVKAIVEAHGGEVTLSSEVGAGSTFEVRFPRVRGDGRPDSPDFK